MTEQVQQQTSYTKVEGSLTIKGPNGTVSFAFEGSKPPQKLAEMDGYVAKLIKRALTGLDESQVEGLKKAKLDAERLVEIRNEEIAVLKKLMKQHKVALPTEPA